MMASCMHQRGFQSATMDRSGLRGIAIYFCFGISLRGGCDAEAGCQSKVDPGEPYSRVPRVRKERVLKGLWGL